MAQRVHVSVPDEHSGRSLVAELGDAFATRLAADDRGWQVTISPNGGFDRMLADLLPRLERWVGAGSAREIAVEIDGRHYTMVAPADGSLSDVRERP